MLILLSYHHCLLIKPMLKLFHKSQFVDIRDIIHLNKKAKGSSISSFINTPSRSKKEKLLLRFSWYLFLVDKNNSTEHKKVMNIGWCVCAYVHLCVCVGVRAWAHV